MIALKIMMWLFQYLVFVPVAFIALCLLCLLTGLGFWGSGFLGFMLGRAMFWPWGVPRAAQL